MDKNAKTVGKMQFSDTYSTYSTYSTYPTYSTYSTYRSVCKRLPRTPYSPTRARSKNMDWKRSGHDVCKLGLMLASSASRT